MIDIYELRTTVLTFHNGSLAGSLLVHPRGLDTHNAVKNVFSCTRVVNRAQACAAATL